MAPTPDEPKDTTVSQDQGDDQSGLQPESPVVTVLKSIDDEYLQIKRECEREVHEVQRKHAERQRPLLERRARVLARAEGADDLETGTPALSGFWLQSMANHPAVKEHVEEWDAPVLQYLRDVTQAPRSVDDDREGFRLEFHFAENPFFSNTVLWKEYVSEEHSPYTGAIEVQEIKACAIEWKAGMDVTVESVKKKKKAKGGGAKNAGKALTTQQPRESFFRTFFRNLKEGMRLSEEGDAVDDDEYVDSEGMLDMIMEQDHDMGCAFRDSLIPFAVRFYTGEATPEDLDEDDSVDEESGTGDEDNADDDDSDDDTADQQAGKADKANKDDVHDKNIGDDKAKQSRAKGEAKAKAKAKAKAVPGAAGSGDVPNKDECKQQ